MSIIQEALKKAERQIKDPKHAASPQAPASGNASRAAPSAKGGPAEARKAPAAGSDPRAVAILLVILLVTAAVAASQLFPKKDIPSKPSVAAVTPAAEELPVLPSVIFQQPAAAGQPPAQLLAEKKAAPPEFVLNGIMYLEGSPRAIINDSMVEAGDMVGGARVVKIEKKNVLLEYNGAEMILDLK